MKKLKESLRYVWKTIKVWRELVSTFIGFILWILSPTLLRRLDPTSATYDAGVFQVFLFAIIGLFMLHGVIRLLMKLIWPSADRYLDQEFAIDFKTITIWQKLKLSTAIFFAFLFAAVLLVRTL